MNGHDRIVPGGVNGVMVVGHASDKDLESVVIRLGREVPGPESSARDGLASSRSC